MTRDVVYFEPVTILIHAAADFIPPFISTNNTIILDIKVTSGSDDTTSVCATASATNRCKLLKYNKYTDPVSVALRSATEVQQVQQKQQSHYTVPVCCTSKCNKIDKVQHKVQQKFPLVSNCL